MKKYFEFILPRSHNQLIHNNKRLSFIDKLLLYKFVHFMTYIVPFYPHFISPFYGNIYVNVGGRPLIGRGKRKILYFQVQFFTQYGNDIHIKVNQ